jgi:Na+/proline symporter
MGGIAVAFTTLGGAKALAWSHFQQMAVMVIGLVAALLCAVLLLPSHVSFFDAVNLAGVAGRLNPITTNFDWNDRYNLWSGLFGGMFLALAYFGTDQSQVQRYLSGSSIAQSRLSLLFNAVAKIPMQFFILFIGAMVFVFYIYQQPPILFDRTEVTRLESPKIQADYGVVAKKYDEAFLKRRAAADGLIGTRQDSALHYEQARVDFGSAQREMDGARREASALIEKAGGKKVNDTNYIFLTFVTKFLPAGLVGLVLAVILGATMSSISSEMNSLATVTFIDIFQRYLWKAAPERHHLFASKAATVFWGVYAVITAQYVKRMGSLIEAVNVLGSFFYGGMLGVFVLACFFPNVRGRGAFWGVLLGEAAVFACWYFTTVAFLWYNVLGCLVVVVSGVLISGFDSKPSEVRPATLS